jgi:hypothetical protein
MTMVDFAVLGVKVLVLIWAAQLVWIGSRLLERLLKIVVRSVSTLEKKTDRPNAVSRESRWISRRGQSVA